MRLGNVWSQCFSGSTLIATTVQWVDVTESASCRRVAATQCSQHSQSVELSLVVALLDQAANASAGRTREGVRVYTISRQTAKHSTHSRCCLVTVLWRHGENDNHKKKCKHNRTTKYVCVPTQSTYPLFPPHYNEDN